MDKNYKGIAYKFGRKVPLETLQCMYKPKSQVNGANFHANMSQVKLDLTRNSTQETIFILANCFYFRLFNFQTIYSKKVQKSSQVVYCA